MSDKFKPIVKDGKIGVAYDGDGDGVDSVKFSIFVSEAAGEILNKGEAVEGEAVVKFKIDPVKGLYLGVDTDKDGEVSIELEANLIEAIKEAGILK